MPDEAFIASICREMKWTYDEYCNQPDWFIETIQVMMSVEGKQNTSKKEKKMID